MFTKIVFNTIFMTFCQRHFMLVHVELSKQYNSMSSDFNAFQMADNNISRKAFYERLPFPLSGKKLIDIACGDGIDIAFYQSRGAICSGTDASVEMISIAKAHLVDTDLHVAEFNTLPYQNDSFDIALSKYAFQTAEDTGPIFSEISRILKPGGYFMYLVVHPFRQFVEKKKNGKNYFEKEIVDSVIFDGKLVVKEPTHTMTEYFSPEFCKNFIIEEIYEGVDFPAAEQIGDDIYPTFLIVKAKRK
jgi:ubiquinone/menaquinone biosynthesis C-methylase UbiE